MASRDAVKRCLLNHRTINKAGCWLWTDLLYSNGYGRLRCADLRLLNPISSRVHILSYWAWIGKLPKGKFVCHTCDVKNCFNPEHIWIGTNRDNQLDAVRKGKFSKYWTDERKEERRQANIGYLNPMYGRRGVLAPCYGRVGSLHPMFGKQQSDVAKQKISEGLLKYHKERSKQC